jgi:RNA polymerase sigma factor (sigma-70 family)
MDATILLSAMSQQDQRIDEVVGREHDRLRSFIRRRVADPADAEDILQDVFFELVQAYRLLQPIEEVSAWIFRVARNRIVDLFRRRRSRPPADAAVMPPGEEGPLLLAELLPSRDAGPEEEFARHVLFDELEAALEELPPEQREVFIAHEIEGRSFKEIAASTGVGINTLLSRKHYAVRSLRRRLRAIHDEFVGLD